MRELTYNEAALEAIAEEMRRDPKIFYMSTDALPPLLKEFGSERIRATPITEAALSGPWRRTLEPLLRPAPVAEPEFYYDLLAPSTASLDIWETEYLQVLDGANPVKEWTKGTWLLPLLAALDEPERSRFEAAYAERVAAFVELRYGAPGQTRAPGNLNLRKGQ